MTKFAAFGTALLMDGTEIAAVTNIGGPGLSLDTIDVTSHDQTSAWEEMAVTILRQGEMTLDLVFDPAETTHADLLANLVGRGYESFELQFPDSAYTEWTFNAYVIGFEPSMAVDGALTASCTLKITGVPVLTSNYTP